jgi:hypothetical protein
MIYLFDRLYLETDQYIRNDKKKMAALLGPAATAAKKCKTLQYDFGKIQLDESVADENLSAYLTGLLDNSEGQRVVVYTTDDMIIKIMAFYCSSIFSSTTPEFIKELILLDKKWIDDNPGTDGHRDFALRHKGKPKLDVTNIDRLVAEGMAIYPKLTNLGELRLEYLFAAYLNNSLSYKQRTDFEEKIKVIFYDANWIGQLVKTIMPMALTFLTKAGVDLDNFDTDTIRQHRPAYFKIFDTSIIGDPTCFDRVTLEDWMNFFNQCNADFGWEQLPSLKAFFANFYADKDGFIRSNCLDPSHISDYYCNFDLGKVIKVNPWLWYTIVREYNNPDYINRFRLNV